MSAGRHTLKRETGVLGATLLGLGSIMGTGVFVGIGVAAEIAGPAVLLAIVLAALLALCNALSSAQLAAAHPVSGGTYEYGRRYLNPTLGFMAGWVFLCAKGASAAAAALGFSGYLLALLGLPADWRQPLALAAAAAVTGLVLGGLRRSNWVNAVLVGVTLGSLIAFMAAGAPRLLEAGADRLTPFFPEASGPGGDVGAVLHATALMFVAYAGYARIATLGEEIKDPRRSIPRAILATLAVTVTVYLGVGLTAIGAAGVDALGQETQRLGAPLEAAARALDMPWLGAWVAVGAIAAMLGVLLNLVLGLSRVALAMGRRGDLPPLLGRVGAAQNAPAPAVIAVGATIAAITLVGDFKTVWAFSAFSVLIYYGLTNLAALRLPPEARLYPRLTAWAGLGGCLFLAAFVPVPVWGTGLAVIAIGLGWRMLALRLWPNETRRA